MTPVYFRFGDSRFRISLRIGENRDARLHWLTSLLQEIRGATLRSNRVREVTQNILVSNRLLYAKGEFHYHMFKLLFENLNA